MFDRAVNISLKRHAHILENNTIEFSISKFPDLLCIPENFTDIFRSFTLLEHLWKMFPRLQTSKTKLNTEVATGVVL